MHTYIYIYMHVCVWMFMLEYTCFILVLFTLTPFRFHEFRAQRTATRRTGLQRSPGRPPRGSLQGLSGKSVRSAFAWQIPPEN